MPFLQPSSLSRHPVSIFKVECERRSDVEGKSSQLYLTVTIVLAAFFPSLVDNNQKVNSL
jgi:hypothetical protein